MALTGNTVASTYLDLVQLEQSGAGLPSGVGGPAQLYDGAGNLINARSYVPSILDPCPDAAIANGGSAFTQTSEFNVDKNQTTLEADGWTFSNCTASVAGGRMVLLTTGNNPEGYFSVSLTGDFDFIIVPMSSGNTFGSTDQAPFLSTLADRHMGIYVVDTVNNKMHGISYAQYGSTQFLAKCRSMINGAYSTKTGFTTNEDNYNTPAPVILRVMRVSGTIYAGAAGPGYAYLLNSAGNRDMTADEGWFAVGSVADSNTMTRVGFYSGATTTPPPVQTFAAIRRYK